MSYSFFAERDPATKLDPETYKVFKRALRDALPKAVNELSVDEIAC